MLNYFPIFIKAEKIHSHILFITWPSLVCMEIYQVVFGNCPYKFNLFIWIVPRHFVEIVNKALLPIAHRWIVLDVFRAYIFLNCFGWFS